LQIAPSIALKPVIKHYLFLSGAEAGIKKLQLFPDGNMAMVFSFESNLLSNQCTIPERLPGSFVYGQITDYLNITSTGKFSLLVVVFQPYGITRLLNIPADELNNKIIPAENIFGNAVGVIREQCFAAKSSYEAVAMLDKYFMKLFNDSYNFQLGIANAGVDYILRNNGLLSMTMLSKYLGYQERQTERIFKASIGLSPKRFSSIVQLHYFIGMLGKSNEKKNLLQLSLEAGFYDQAHLNRNFKAFTGLTPYQYISAQPHLLAVNFLPVIS
jgi:AraC-like DNA-binding protein